MVDKKSRFKDLNTDFLHLRVPESKKDKEWYKFQAKRLIPSTNTLPVEDYEEMHKMYKFFNNDLDDFTEDIRHYCGNLEDYGATREKLIPYNPIPTKIEVLLGELLSMGNTHRIILLTAQAHRNKDKELYDLIMKSVNEELRLEVEKMKAQLENMAPEEVNNYIESLRTEIAPKDINVKNFLSESEITFNKLLQYTYHDQSIQSKKLETFKDEVISDRFYLYPGWQYGRPYIKVLNPLHVGFNKSPNTPYIQKGDYVWYRDEITIADALQEYGNKLTDDELEKVMTFGFNATPIVGKNHMQRPVFDRTRWQSLLAEEYGYSYNDKGVGLNMGRGTANINWTASLFRVHMEFKAFKEVIFYTYKDEDGIPVTTLLNGNTSLIPEHASEVKFTNKFNEASTKYVWADETGNTHEAELLWIPRRYELTRLGEDIYVDCREVPFQPDNLENPFTRFELTYKGGIVNARNARFVSLMQRALPYAFQYMAIENLKDREIADYVGHEKIIDVQQIPDELAANNGDGQTNPSFTEDKVFAQEVIARKTKMRLIDSMQTSNGLPPPPTRTLGVTHQVVDTSQQIMMLDQLASAVNIKVGMAMGVGPQREGATSPGTNVTDNRQNLQQFSLSTQTYFFYHDKVWQDTLNEHLYNLKVWIKKVFEDGDIREHSLQYVLPNGSVETLKITPATLDKLEDIGLYVYNTGKDKLYFDIMLNNMQPLMQNMGEDVGAISEVLKNLVSTSSVEEVHKEILMIGERAKKQQQAVEEAKMRTLDEQKKAQLDMLNYQAELKLSNDLKYLEAEQNYKALLAKIEADRYRMANDVNRNSQDDKAELEQLKMQHESIENEKDRQNDLALARLSAKSKSKPA